MKKSFSYTLLLISSLLCVTMCTHINEPVAGFNSDTGNAKISLSLHSACKESIPNVTVSLRHANYLPGISSQTATPPGLFIFDRITDTTGRVVFDSLIPGTYVLSAITDSARAVAVRCTVTAGDRDVDLGSYVPEKIGSLTGTVVLPSYDTFEGYVRIFGLDRIAKVDKSTGTWNLDSLAPGEFDIRICAIGPKSIPVTYRNISVLPDSSTLVPETDFNRFFAEDYSTWLYNKKIIINTSPTGADIVETVFRFPLLIRLNSAHFNFSEAQPDGIDLRFSDANGMHLPYEIEYWDAALQSAAIWVLTDTIAGNNASQYITMYWGKNSASDFSRGEWVFSAENGYRGVWHMSEGQIGEDGMPSIYRDQTGHEYHGADFVTSDAQTALIGKGQFFDGDKDYVHIDSWLWKPQSLTVSAWVKLAQYNKAMWFIMGEGGAKPRLRFNENKYLCFEIGGNHETPLPMEKLQSDAVNRWIFVTGVWDGVHAVLYRNGIPVDTTDVAGESGVQGSLYFSRKHSYSLHGFMDEIRISDTPRRADWCKLTYANQKQQGMMLGFE